MDGDTNRKLERKMDEIISMLLALIEINRIKEYGKYKPLSELNKSSVLKWRRYS